MKKQRYSARASLPTEPFASATDAWFWFMSCHQARLDGARSVAGLGAVTRPCEPADIHQLVTRLYRSRRLRSHHLTVLVRYGRAMLPPDHRGTDRGADLLHWNEAMIRLEEAFRGRGIIS
ncbi:MAG: hypothetical protein ACREH6_06870 [Geminicoccaceae bacterium]